MPKIYNWTDKTSTGLLNDELDNVLHVDGPAGSSPSSGDIYRFDGSEFTLWSPKYITATMSANQGSVVGGQHVEFRTTNFGSGISLSAGVGQAAGVFTLPPGIFVIDAAIQVSFTAGSGSVQLSWAVNGGANLAGQRMVIRPPTTGADIVTVNVARLAAGFPSGADIELRILSPTSVNQILSTATNATIHAIA